MVALVIQKGSTRAEYVSNLESSIKNPVDLDKVNQIISLLETNNLQNTKTCVYIKQHQNNLRVWGAKTHNYGNMGFEDVKKALGEMMGFVAGDFLKYVGTISEINDIDNKDINSKVSSILWEDPNWLNIWFLDNVRSIDNLSRNWMNSIIGVNIFSEVFTSNMQDNLRIIDSSKAAENRIELLIKAILENSAPVKIERERTIAEAAKLALEELEKESELETIYNKILEKSLYRFGAVEPLTALRIQMDRYSNNVQREDSSKESYFYRKNGKYGLLSWLEAKDVKSDPIFDLLEKKKQIILYGPPGTGKTYQARNFAVRFLEGHYENNTK